MNIATLGQTIAKAAPLLGGALAGPGGAAIGAVIATAFGGTLADTPDLIQRIEADPEASVKLLAIQSRHEIALQRIQVQLAEQQCHHAEAKAAKEGEDRANARHRDIMLAESGHPEWTPAILAYFLTLGVFAALYYLFLYPVPRENKELIVGIISALTTVWVGAMAYYHGSSIGSRAKDKLLFPLPANHTAYAAHPMDEGSSSFSLRHR
jgi:hypothetical protein